MAFEDILYEVEAGVATVTLNRPDRLNAWRGVMEAELRQAMRLAADDAEVKVIVLTGAGRGFCAGADMDVLQGAVSAGGTGGGAPDAFDPASPETALSLAFTAVPDTAPASPETALSLARASASATAFRCAAAEAVSRAAEASAAAAASRALRLPAAEAAAAAAAKSAAARSASEADAASARACTDES